MHFEQEGKIVSQLYTTVCHFNEIIWLSHSISLKLKVWTNHILETYKSCLDNYNDITTLQFLILFKTVLLQQSFHNTWKIKFWWAFSCFFDNTKASSYIQLLNMIETHTIHMKRPTHKYWTLLYPCRRN